MEIRLFLAYLLIALMLVAAVLVARTIALRRQEHRRLMRGHGRPRERSAGTRHT
jgi:hypothetical protein